MQLKCAGRQTRYRFGGYKILRDDQRRILEKIYVHGSQLGELARIVGRPEPVIRLHVQFLVRRKELQEVRLQSGKVIGYAPASTPLDAARQHLRFRAHREVWSLFSAILGRQRQSLSELQKWFQDLGWAPASTRNRLNLLAQENLITQVRYRGSPRREWVTNAWARENLDPHAGPVVILRGRPSAPDSYPSIPRRDVLGGISCPNRDCIEYGRLGAETLRVHGKRNSDGRLRIRCRACGETFGEGRATIVNQAKMGKTLVIAILHELSERRRPGSVARELEIPESTVRTVIRKAVKDWAATERHLRQEYNVSDQQVENFRRAVFREHRAVRAAPRPRRQSSRQGEHGEAR